ncbi:MAG: DUF99 family protein [Candidatus Marsarchaeota archaeon]|nr:DUF99 family protein [Candidatus Marsarchaeota archaeon]MCL5094454.1 DUF99 family protein [Candidatus Marsarchaeota archaeon]
MKNGIRIIAITSSPFIRQNIIKPKPDKKQANKKNKVLIIGVIGRKNTTEGILSKYIDINGNDATDKIIRMIKYSRFFSQIKLIALNGIAIAGLNIVDIYKIKKQLDIDAVVITRDRPRPGKLINALKKFGKGNKKSIKNQISIIKKYKKENIYHEKFYIQTLLELKDIKNIITSCTDLLRLSHLIARGVKTGESKGRI